MTEVDRLILVRGEEGWYHATISCALREDGSSPAREVMNAMELGEWAADPYFDGPPDREQIHDHAKLLAELEYLAEIGEPSGLGKVNYLHRGVWEVKAWFRRLAYFDTPGDGTYTEKPKIKDIRDLPEEQADRDYWWYPEMDLHLRVTHLFMKDGEKAPDGAIDEACEIREEDVAHDRS